MNVQSKFEERLSAEAGMFLNGALNVFVENIKHSVIDDEIQRLGTSAQYALSQQNYGLAEDLLLRCIELNARHSWVYNLMACTFLHQNKKLMQAKVFAEKAVANAKSDPHLYIYHDTLSEAHARLANWNKSIAHGKKSLQLGKSINAAYTNVHTAARIGSVYLNLEIKDFKNAAKYLDEAVHHAKFDPHLYYIHMWVGEAKIGLKLYQIALQHYQYALSLVEQHAYLTIAARNEIMSNCHANIGIAFYQLGHLDHALQSFNMSSMLLPTNPFANAYAAVILFKKRQLDAGWEKLETSIGHLDLQTNGHSVLVQYMLDEPTFLQEQELYLKLLQVLNASRLIPDEELHIRIDQLKQQVAGHKATSGQMQINIPKVPRISLLSSKQIKLEIEQSNYERVLDVLTEACKGGDPNMYSKVKAIQSDYYRNKFDFSERKESVEKYYRKENLIIQRLLALIEELIREGIIPEVPHLDPGFRGPAHTRILFTSANTDGTALLRLNRELKEIEKEIRLSPERDRFVLDQILEVTVRELRRRLLSKNPNIVHFSGHGNESGIVLFNDRDEPELLRSKDLSALFRDSEQQIMCVVLNACYSDVQAREINKSIAYVIGMPNAIQDDDALRFSYTFYMALGAGKTVAKAFANAKDEFGRGRDYPSESMPRFYLNERLAAYWESVRV